jgi:hypothetical protein
LAAAVVVGERDVEGLQLTPTPVLPIGIGDATPPGPAGALPPGSTIPMVSVRGTVLGKDSSPIPFGVVFVTGGAYGTSFSIDGDGRFEFHHLLPGRYNIEISMFGYETLKETISVGDEGLEWTARPVALPASETEQQRQGPSSFFLGWGLGSFP